MNDHDHYRLDCHACDETIMIPAQDGAWFCPKCGAILRLEWSGGIMDYERERAAAR